jgi:hypothetical protein
LLAGSYAVGVSISAWKAYSVLRQKETAQAGSASS